MKMDEGECVLRIVVGRFIAPSAPYNRSSVSDNYVGMYVADQSMLYVSSIKARLAALLLSWCEYCRPSRWAGYLDRSDD
jgi:hypothetical protein